MKKWYLWMLMRIKYMGQVFVEFWDGNDWQLSAIPWYAYLWGRWLDIIGAAHDDRTFYAFRHVPKDEIEFTGED